MVEFRNSEAYVSHPMQNGGLCIGRFMALVAISVTDGAGAHRRTPISIKLNEIRLSSHIDDDVEAVASGLW